MHEQQTCKECRNIHLLCPYDNIEKNKGTAAVFLLHLHNPNMSDFSRGIKTSVNIFNFFPLTTLKLILSYPFLLLFSYSYKTYN